MSQWLLPIIGSALMLGIYDVCKKHAVKNNAVMPVLFLSTLCGTIFFVCLTLLRGNTAALSCTPGTMGLIALKSLMVSASWTCVYYGLRELPVSIASPLRSTSPLWCVAGAILIFGEMPRPVQWFGMALIFAGGVFFALIGKKEDFSWRSKGMLLTISGTILGAGCALFDKFLLAECCIPPVTLQFYFAVFLVIILGSAFALRYICFSSGEKFKWKWSIAATGILLIAADALYFYALSCPDAQISILSMLRRSNVVISFALGGGLFREQLLLHKGAALAVILIGVVVLSLC